MKDKYDTLEEVKKSPYEAQTFEEVLKFNPFHGYHGYFSSANNMRTYSANPKTKAGAMAIERSNAAGYGTTMNVHAESKGENIGQNATWLKTGEKPTQNDKIMAEIHAIANEKNPTSGRLDANGAPEGQVKGKDISKKFHYDQNQTVAGGWANHAINQVAEAQGFNGKPTVVTHEEFIQAVKDTGMIGFRTIGTGNDFLTGEYRKGEEFSEILMYGEGKDFSYNGHGGTAYGQGLYSATASGKKGSVPKDAINAFADSKGYGSSMVQFTLSPTAKVLKAGTKTYDKIRSEFFDTMTAAERMDKYDDDLGVFIATKGYDAVRWPDAGWGNDYTTVYNRTAMIISQELPDISFGADAPQF